jgi:hypothetical protein
MIRALFLSLLATASAQAAALVYNVNDVQFWVGSGPNEAVIILDWQDGKHLPGDPAGQAIAWGYRWSGTQGTPTDYDALLAIDAADPRLQLKFTTFSETGSQPFFFGAYYDLNSNGGTPTFDPAGESGFSSDPDDHFQEGARINGFWGFVLGHTVGADLPSSWDQSHSGAQGRLLVSGCWDAWVFSTDLANFNIPDPVPAAVPEPNSVCLALVSLAASVCGFRRR